jgi:hypothetical protein
VCGLDQQGAGMNITALGDAAHTASGTGGMFRRHQTKLGHEVGC